MKMTDDVIEGVEYSGYASSMSTQEQQLLRLLKKEREEASKREEALSDRFTLQESIANKQIQQLKTQMKKLQADATKSHRNRDLTATPVSVKGDHKRDGKSRDIRELQKTVASLRAENESLDQKLQKLTDFVKVASDIKTKAIGQCAAKDDEITSLQHELRALENVYDEEVQRRVKIESELRSMRIYVDYVGQKGREKMINRSSQTEMTVSPKFVLEKGGSTTQRSPSNTSSFANLSAAASALRVKSLEMEYRNETRKQKQKFNDAMLPLGSSTYPNARVRKDASPDHRRHKFSSSSTSETEKQLQAYQKIAQGDRPSTRPAHSATRTRKLRKVRKTLSDESVAASLHGYWDH